jgi:hypothetical protein
MICDKNKIIFIHIPRTGGTSIEKFFFKHQNFRDFGVDDKGNYIQHYSLPELINKNLVSNDQVKNYYKFAFVRNPWDRILSEFLFQKKHESIVTNMSFEIFLEETSKLLNDQPSLLSSIRGISKHLGQQHDYTKNSELNFIGRFENLQEDFEKVLSFIGHTPSIYLTKENSSKHEHYSHYFNQKTKDLVAKIYHDDIHVFDYSFSKNYLWHDITRYYLPKFTERLYKLSAKFKKISPLYTKIIDIIKR